MARHYIPTDTIYQLSLSMSLQLQLSLLSRIYIPSSCSDIFDQICMLFTPYSSLCMVQYCSRKWRELDATYDLCHNWTSSSFSMYQGQVHHTIYCWKTFHIHWFHSLLILQWTFSVSKPFSICNIKWCISVFVFSIFQTVNVIESPLFCSSSLGFSSQHCFSSLLTWMANTHTLLLSKHTSIDHSCISHCFLPIISHNLWHAMFSQ